MPRSHLMSKHRLFPTWKTMRMRCNNPNNTNFQHYGGRGIKVCARWDDFSKFIEDMGPTWKEGLWLERKDNALGYGPDNCEWRTPLEQCRNTRKNRMHDTPFGRMCSVELAERYGLNVYTLSSRLRRKWSVERIVGGPMVHAKAWHAPSFVEIA